MAKEETAIGPLIIIGGGEDKKGDMTILRRVVDLTRLTPDRQGIGIVTTASELGNTVFDGYRDVFARLGLQEIFSLDIQTRSQAESREVEHLMRRASAVFFAGGDQLRITSCLGGTRFHRALIDEHRRGLVVAGTSAGASMMSHTMIVAGDAEESPTRNTVTMATGMGLWIGAVIDQHFSQRGRIGRLLSALAQNPDDLGVGLDEDTAIEVWLDRNRFNVLGSQTVTILDGHSIRQTNASELSPGQPLALVHVVLHVLCPGFGFDLKTRSPIALSTRHDIEED